MTETFLNILGKACAVLSLLGSLTAYAQNSTDGVDCSIDPKPERAKSENIVSLGVINGKAINLVTPDYPAAARAVGVRGSVNVVVVVDPRGCVAEAKAVSGHLMLRDASVKAALRSSFEPLTIGGKRIWVNGVITYNYVSDTANWLEIGYFSDSPEKLSELLPDDFEKGRTKQKPSQPIPLEMREFVSEAAAKKIRSRLSGHPKEAWLFDVGRHLRTRTSFKVSGIDGFKEWTAELETLVKASPADVKPGLVNILNQMIKESSSPEFWNRVREFEERLYYLGN